MARIEVNTLAENQNIMFDEFRKLLDDKVTNDPRSALYMLLFPISLLARHKNEKIQTLADKMNVTKCEGSELDDILNSNLSFPRKNPNYATVFITLRGGLGVQLYAGDLIIEAKDGREAISKFNHDINLIILDIQIPFVNGLDVLKEIRRKSKVPVLILTA